MLVNMRSPQGIELGLQGSGTVSLGRQIGPQLGMSIVRSALEVFDLVVQVLDLSSKRVALGGHRRELGPELGCMQALFQHSDPNVRRVCPRTTNAAIALTSSAARER